MYVQKKHDAVETIGGGLDPFTSCKKPRFFQLSRFSVKKAILLLLLLCILTTSWSQTLTISSTGNTSTTGGTGYSVSNGVISVSSNTSIRPTVISTLLASGNVAIVPSSGNTLNVTFNNLLSYTAQGNSLTLGASNNTGVITLNAGITLAGDLTIYGSTIAIESLNTSSGNGDILLSASTNITATTSGRQVVSGSGNITLETDNLDNTSRIMEVTTTGILTFRPYADSWPESFCGTDFNFAGIVVAGPPTDFWGAGEIYGLRIFNYTALGGLILGKTESTRNITFENISNVTSFTVNGPISLYGGTVTVIEPLVSTNTSNGTILLKGSSVSSSVSMTPAASQSLIFDISSSTTYAVNIGLSDISLTKSGSGSLTLSGSNDFYNSTILNGGALILGSANSIQYTSSIIFNGGTLQYTSSNTTDYSSKFSTAANQAYSINTNGQNRTFGTALTSSGGTMNKLGSGTLTLSGANTYSGLTTVSAGTLQLNRTGGTTIPTTNDVTVSGGTFRVSTSQALNNLTISSGATLTVDAGVTLTVNGTFTGGGTLQNNGTMVIKGASFPGSTSTISSMTNLEIDRSAGVTLDKSLTVSGVLTLTSGKLSVGNNTLTVTGSITGASSSNYIATTGTGTLYRSISGSSTFLFPVGNSTYNPVSITNTGTTDNFWIRVADDVLEGGSTGNPITDKIVNRTWHIGKTNATINAGVNMTFQWEQNEEVGSVTNHKLSHYGTYWAPAMGTSGSVSVNGTTKSLTHTGYAGTFSPFAIGGLNSTLPVTWHSVSGKIVSQGVEVNWSTSTEQNTQDFQVQHSNNTQQWSTLGIVPAAGTSHSIRTYSFVHQGPFFKGAGNYYRILQRDLDGKSSFSKIIKIDDIFPTNKMIVYPNPASDVIRVVLPVRQTLTLLNMHGEVLWKDVLPAGSHALPVSNFAAGTYILQTGSDNYKVIIR